MKPNIQQLKNRKNLYFQWDTYNWSHALDLWLPHLKEQKLLMCLEIGSQNGSLSLLVSDFEHQVLCTDLTSPYPLAKKFHEEHGFNHQLISYAALNALEIHYENHFDIIIFKSVLGGIGRDEGVEKCAKVIQQLYKALKPGGKILFAENTRGSHLHSMVRKLMRRWGGSWYYLKQEDITTLFSNFSSLEYQMYGVTGLLSSRHEFFNKQLSIIDRLISPIIPNKWKYLVFGVAIK